MFWKKIISFVAPVLFFVLLQLANRYPGQMLYWGIGALVIGAASLYLMRHVWLKEKKDFKVFWLSTFLFILGTFLVFIFLDRPIFRQIIIFVSSFLFFLEMYYTALFLNEKKEFYLGNLSVLNEIIPVLAFFLLGAGFFGWLVFLSKILWIFVFLIFLITLQNSYNLFYNTLGKEFPFSPLWVIAVVVTEMFWALDFLPVGFLIKGMILTIGWWLLTKTLIEIFSKNKKMIKIYTYSFVALILIIIILLSTRWI